MRLTCSILEGYQSLCSAEFLGLCLLQNSVYSVVVYVPFNFFGAIYPLYNPDFSFPRIQDK